MDNSFVWLIIGPIIYSWVMGGPLVGLFVAGYIGVVFGFRLWLTLLVAFVISFGYYWIIIPADGWIGGLWPIKLAMAVHTAWMTALILWGINKLRRSRKSKQEKAEK